MTALDVADLVVMGGRALGIGTGAALEQVDTQAAETALADAPVALSLPDSYAAAAACAQWQADLGPPQVAAIVFSAWHHCASSLTTWPDG